MAYSRGDAKQIIVGAAALFVSTGTEFSPVNADGTTKTTDLPNFSLNDSYRDTLTDWAGVRNVGYTSNGLELQFQPDFGEVQVDQLLDVAKLYKQGMQVSLNTTFAEATLENLLIAVAAKETDLSSDALVSNPMETSGGNTARVNSFDVQSGAIGSCPVERGLVAIGPGTGDCAAGEEYERVYVAYRALSIENVTVSAKRDEASMFEVSFRLLPASNGSYGKVIDRKVKSTATF